MKDKFYIVTCIATALVGFSIPQIIIQTSRGNGSAASIWTAIALAACWIRTLK